MVDITETVHCIIDKDIRNPYTGGEIIMERDFYAVTDEWGEENVFEDRTIDDVVNEFSKLYHGNHLRVIWSLVDFMKATMKTEMMKQPNFIMEQMYR